MTQHHALTDPEYSTPGDSRGLISVFQYRYLLSLLIKKGVSTRYYGSALGWTWSYIRPLAQFCMYWVVIGILLGVSRGVDYFPIYLFSGIVVVNLFSETFRNTTDALIKNKALIGKIFLPRELFPVSAAFGAIIHFLPQTVVLLVVCIVMGWTVTWFQVLAFLAAIALTVVFALGLGLFFGAFNVLYRDSKNFVDLILMFATWSSPVLYTFDRVQRHAPDWLYHLYMSNPVTGSVELMHTVFWDPIANSTVRPPHLEIYVLVGAGITLLTLFVGQFVFHRLEGRFAQNL